MKKKTRQRFLLCVWLLVAVAAVSLWVVAPRLNPPRMVWRVPVGFQVPAISIPDSLPDAVGETVKDAGEAVKGAVEGLIQKDQDNILNPYPEGPQEAPGSPYVAKPKQSATPLAESPKTSPEAIEGQGGIIALIIDDMGLAAASSTRATRLPAVVTLSYMPYASNLEEQVGQAKAKGHEIMLHLPMEPMGSEKPGPGALMASMEPDEVRAATIKALDSFQGYVGVNNHMGSKFTLLRKGMEPVIEVMRERGLYFVDSRTGAKSIAEDVAREAGLRVAGRDVFLDDKRTPDAVRAELERVEAIASRKGWAIAIGHPHAVTLDALEEWIPKAEAKGYRFVPVSELVK